MISLTICIYPQTNALNREVHLYRERPYIIFRPFHDTLSIPRGRREPHRPQLEQFANAKSSCLYGLAVRQRNSAAQLQFREIEVFAVGLRRLPRPVWNWASTS